MQVGTVRLTRKSTADDMDDRLEREAALYSLSSLNREVLKSFEDGVEMLDALEEVKVITGEEKDDANENEEYHVVLEKLKEKIDADPNFFVVFCRHIQQQEELRSLSKRLLDTYSETTLNGQSSTLPAVVEVPSKNSPLEKGDQVESDASSCGNDSNDTCRDRLDVEMKKLRDKLRVFQEIPCESEDVKEELVKMSKGAIKTFITTCLDRGVAAHTVHVALENLHTKDMDIVIDGNIYHCSLEELDKQNKIRNPDSDSLQDLCAQPLNEVKFGKVEVQNSIFACHLLEQTDTDVLHLACTHSLFEFSKSKPLRLETKRRHSFQSKDFRRSESLSKVRISPAPRTSSVSTYTEMIEITVPNTSEGGVHHQYLIAKGSTDQNGHVTYYIAFSSHLSLREWNENHSSFENGFKKQQEQLPIQFILEKLWEGASVVLTGFSFGGILAQLCGLYLWSLSQGICPELLERNLLCITFGQPIISLPKITNYAEKDVNKNRFHAIYISDDKVPSLLSCLDPSYTQLTASDMPDKLRNQVGQEEIFQNPLSSFAMKQMITLQENSRRAQEVTQEIKSNVHHKSDQSEKVLLNPTTAAKIKQRLLGDDKTSLTAKQTLQSLLRQLRRQSRMSISSCMTYKKLGNGEFIEFQPSDVKFRCDLADIQEDVFDKHNTDNYLQVITQQYTKKPPLAIIEEADTLDYGHFVQPSVKRLEIHHFSHHKCAALSLEGYNLCFTFKVVLSLHDSEREHEIMVAQKESVSSRSIQIQGVPISVPRGFSSSTDSTVSNDCQESEETARIHLFTHFGEFTFENVEVRHKKFYISCRRQQVANLTVQEVIELSFLGALLEKHPRSLTSKRYRVIQKFLEVIVEVVPIESVFSCIASMTSDHNARHLCHMLKRADIKPPLSLTFFINAALAITKLRGETVNFYDTASLEDLFYVFYVAAKKRASPIFWSSPQPVDEGRYLKWFGPDVSSYSRNGDMVRYLQTSVDDAIRRSSGRIPAISGISVNSLFETTEAMTADDRNPVCTAVKSPTSLLKEGKRELQNLQTKARDRLKAGPWDLDSFTKANNTMLLDYVKKLRSEDLHICIQTITAFMEEQVRIPVKDFNVSVSYWQLLKLGLGILRKKVSSNFVTQYISVSKHVRIIADDSSHAVDPYQSVNEANSKYAGKLQFLLSASLRHDQPPLFDDKFLVYSLENHLYARFAHVTVPKGQRIDESTPLEHIEVNWDTLFKDVAMANVVHSHRRLIARWLKFSLLIHKLRAELSCHATVGIVGLVNSGKSTLVKELFNIKEVETGTRAEDRTTVPFLYSIQGVDNFDVIDFPGVDDQDDRISDLVNLLRTLSQLVVFVVNYKNAHTKVAVEWYRKLNQYAIPHLVCLTHGDRLYAECAGEEVRERDLAYTKKAIKKEVEIIREKVVSKASHSPVRSLGLFSLKVDNDSLLNSREGLHKIRDAGILGVKDVGKWIVKALEEHLKEKATAQMLKTKLKL